MPMEFDQGKYRCRIEEARISETKNGNNQVVLKFAVVGLYEASSGQYYEIEAPYKTRHSYCVITEKTQERRAREFLSLAPDMEDFTQLDPQTAPSGKFISLVGKEADFTCREDHWNGRVSEKWEMLVADGGQKARKTEARPEASRLRELKATSSDLFKKLKGGKGNEAF